MALGGGMPDAVPYIQNAFTSGEFAPELIARTDIDSYQRGAAKLYNCFVDYKGGALNRAGTEFCVIAAPGTLPSVGLDNADFYPRLIPFIYEEEQALVLVFSNTMLRFVSDGSYVLEAQKNITAITKANPGVVTSAAHGFANDDIIFIDQIGGMTELNNRYFSVAGVTANTFTLKAMISAIPVDTTTFTTYTSGGRARRVYTVASPYAQQHLYSLKFFQSRDVMFITSPFYEPQKLTRTTPTSWAFATMNFAASTSVPTGVTLDASFVGSGTDYSYKVTAVDADTGVESEASTIATVSKAYWPVATDNVRVDWNAVTNAEFYNIYRASVVSGRGTPSGALYGLIGSAKGTRFDDAQIAPDYSLTPPTSRDPFDAASKYPSCVTAVQQRLAFGATVNRPMKVWTTPVGDFSSMARSLPAKDSDSLTFELASERADPIANMLAMPGGLLAFTHGNIYHIYGGGDGAPLTPTNINSDPVSSIGASDLTPIKVGFDVLYTQYKGGIVRDLKYNWFATSYDSTDLTIIASHFFQKFHIRRWAYANDPWKVLWAVRDDGRLLSLTYMAEQEVFAWALHETQGVVRDVVVIPEHGEDVVYLLTIRLGPPGSELLYVHYSIERMNSRVIDTIEDAWFLDNAKSTGFTYPAADVRVNAATGIGKTITVVGGSFTFTSGDIGKVIRSGGGMMEVASVISGLVATVNIIRDITDLYPNGTPRVIPEGSWSMNSKASSFSGLWQFLDGEIVYGLADGFTVGPLTVTNGAVTLPTGMTASYAIFGKPFSSSIKSLRLEFATRTDPTVQGKRKTIPAVTIRQHKTRGIEIGQDFDEMHEPNSRTDESLGQPPDLISGDVREPIYGDWNTFGQIAVRQQYPLPMQILGLIPEVVLGDT